MTAPSITPEQVRGRALRNRLRRCLLNVSGWWGISPMQATQVLRELSDELTTGQRDGTLKWPDGREAKYDPGMPDQELRELAYQGVRALTAIGVPLSARCLWSWCKVQGARKRQATALRIVGSVVASIYAGEVAASVVRTEK